MIHRINLSTGYACSECGREKRVEAWSTWRGTRVRWYCAAECGYVIDRVYRSEGQALDTIRDGIAERGERE